METYAIITYYKKSKIVRIIEIEDGWLDVVKSRVLDLCKDCSADVKIEVIRLSDEKPVFKYRTEVLHC